MLIKAKVFESMEYPWWRNNILRVGDRRIYARKMFHSAKMFERPGTKSILICAIELNTFLKRILPCLTAETLHMAKVTTRMFFL